ncbi:Gfo/Idh/MocA family protein [Lacipirellula limnantheis]|uniref:Inositol 2-dehydrogenase n=1 Tax=Lacipirellula limnantheis TaxID=2528024 RepID=A0A517U2V6_9BACT|nr:Gfo/Idh/MocA family oxidoreductase [Lacipirellula limnantheis]QDT74959.1 Inositol 2-dehydrogenase [Lacipirellula limnantheis]
MHRRHFLETTLGAAAAAGMVWSSRASAASDVADIRVAQIGFRGQGSSHINNLGKHVVALCDVDEEVLNNKANELKESLGITVDKYSDYRKLLERKDIDAVSIATPNHTHALIAIAAAQAGKDVYVEKPVSNNIWEGRQLAAAARKFGRVIQCGTQSRSSPALKQGAEWVQAGELGPIRYAVATCYKARPSIGKSDTAFTFPSTIDRDLWIGPAADEAFYRPVKNSQGGKNPHYDWHWDFNTGAGDLGNQGIHQMDIARWFLGEKGMAPRVFSVGGRLGYDDAGNTPNTQIVYQAYEKAPLLFEVRGLPRAKKFQENGWGDNMDRFRGSGVGVVVQCENGYVLVPNYSSVIAFDNDGNKVKEWDEGAGHHDNWLKAIAAHDPKLLNAEVQEGHLSSALCHSGNVSYRLGAKTPTGEIAERLAANELLANSFERMLGHLRANGVDVDGDAVLTMGEWLNLDPATEKFVDNDKANELRTRVYRKPFVVPDVESELATQSAAAG